MKTRHKRLLLILAGLAVLGAVSMINEEGEPVAGPGAARLEELLR